MKDISLRCFHYTYDYAPTPKEFSVLGWEHVNIEKCLSLSGIVILPETFPMYVPSVFSPDVSIMRWVLNVPGKLGGHTKYMKNERVYYYNDHLAESAKVASHDGKAYRFKLGTIGKEIKDYMATDKLKCVDIYYQGKGSLDISVKRSTDDLPLLGITRYWPPVRSQLYDLLNRCRTFYSFDDYSALMTEAFLCGAKVLVSSDGGVHWREFEANAEMLEQVEDEVRDRERVRAMVDEMREYHDNRGI